MNDNNLHTIVCKSLDKDVEALSASVQSRLTQRREQALARTKRSSFFSSFQLINQPIKVGAVFASLAFVAMTSVTIFNSEDKVSVETSGEILTLHEPINENSVNGDVGEEFFLTEEDLDFFENLDLYQWLDSEFKIS